MPHDANRALSESLGASFLPYGPPNEDGSPRVAIVETFGQYEGEYAAIRKGAGFFETPHRAAVEMRGGERLDFLQKMITGDVNGLKPGEGRRAFLLGKTGRIVADLVVLELGDRTWLITDALDAPRLVGELSKYVIMEDVELVAADDTWQAAIHGPMAHAVLGELTGDGSELAPLAHRPIRIGSLKGNVYRHDLAGVPGLHLIFHAAAAEEAYRLLVERARADGWRTAEEVEKDVATGHRPAQVGKTRVRPIGWLAFNTARIEAGTPLFHVDFGPNSLPHETGVLQQTVSFTKGCYLGQEIVARMQNLGHPKQTLVGLRLEDERLPLAGAQVLDAGAAAEAPVIGAVTSSTISPMQSGRAVAFAMMKWGKHRPGTAVTVPAEGGRVPAVVQGLSFLPAAVDKP